MYFCSNMESKRQQKFSKLLKEELSELFNREGLSFQNGTLVTITTVRVTPDLGIARIYLSFFNTANAHKSLTDIQAQSRELRFKLGQRIRNDVRIIPELNFMVDDTQDYVTRIDKIFDEIQEKPKSTDDLSNEYEDK